MEISMTDDRFTEFYTSYSRPVWLYIYKLCRDEQMTDEIVQEAFLKVLEKSRAEYNEYQQKGFLYRIATNLVIDSKRKTKLNDKAISHQIRLEESSSTDFYDLEIEQIFQFLNLKEKTILWLAYVEGYSHREIAQMVGISQKSVKVLLFRTRKKVLKKTGTA